MRPSKALETLKPMLAQPTFTAAEARARGVVPALLSHYVKTGRLEKVGRGVYRSPDAPQSSNPQWADLVDATRSISNGTICLISALGVYGLTEEIARNHWIAVSHDTSVRAHPPIKIVRYRNWELGRTNINLDGVDVPIYNRERTILDAFRQLSRETAIKALKAALSKKGDQKLDLKRLQTYARKLRVPIEPYLLAVTT